MATENEKLRFESACTALQAAVGKFQKMAYGVDALKSDILRSTAVSIYVALQDVMQRANERIGS